MLQNFTLGSFAQGVSAGGGAFESIASVTPSGSVSTVTFSSIPSTYTSLQLRINARGTANGGTIPLIFLIRANGDTGSNYAHHNLTGNGATASAASGVTQDSLSLGLYADSGYGSNTYGVTIIDIHDYSSSTRNKTFRSFTGVDDNNTTGGRVSLRSGLWMSTSAITSITINNNGGDNYNSNSTFALYGIKGA